MAVSRRCSLIIITLLLSVSIYGGCISNNVRESRSDRLGLVVLLTDFGDRDHYVGALKGAVYAVNSGLRIDSITHEIPAYNLEIAGHVLAESVRTYPEGTVFCVVVDPGVGTPRRPIVVETAVGHIYIAPDNGVLSRVIREEGMVEAREITNSAFFRKGGMSATFHGRDIFGPVSAHIASGLRLENFGPAITDLIINPPSKAEVSEGVIMGLVSRTDRYGNVITNIPREMLDGIDLRVGDQLAAEIAETSLSCFRKTTYGDVAQGQPLCVITSEGWVEFAINQGNMAESLGIKPGMSVWIRKEVK